MRCRKAVPNRYALSCASALRASAQDGTFLRCRACVLLRCRRYAAPRKRQRFCVRTQKRKACFCAKPQKHPSRRALRALAQNGTLLRKNAKARLLRCRRYAAPRKRQSLLRKNAKAKGMLLRQSRRKKNAKAKKKKKKKRRRRKRAAKGCGGLRGCSGCSVRPVSASESGSGSASGSQSQSLSNSGFRPALCFQRPAPATTTIMRNLHAHAISSSYLCSS